VRRKPIEAVHYVLADANCYEIPCAPYHTFGTPELANDAVKYCGDGDAVLLANHGIIVCGKNLKSAFGLAKNLEYIAELQYRAMCIGKPFVLGKEEMDEVFEGFKSYGQPASGKKGY
jgi:L-fuculose-phosphate aldolase